MFGDSITYGAWDKEGGWVQRLREFLDEGKQLDEGFYYMVYNLGVSGNTTEELLKRFEFETKQRLKEKEETVIIFSIGANDSQFVHSKNNFRTLPQKFEENILKLIEIAQKFSSKIIFVGLTPVDETRVTPIPWNPDVSYKNEYIEKYDEIIRKVCEQKGVFFINILTKLKNLNYRKLLEDGLHPNSEGHRVIFEIVKEFLVENKII